jgi:hypothetical protein
VKYDQVRRCNAFSRGAAWVAKFDSTLYLSLSMCKQGLDGSFFFLAGEGSSLRFACAFVLVCMNRVVYLRRDKAGSRRGEEGRY